MAKRGPYAKGAERREEILRAAFDVLSRDGYVRTSLGQIGRAIGIDAAHILYYFPTREALLQEVLLRWDTVSTALNAPLASDPDAEPFEWWVGAIRRNEHNRGIVQLYVAFAMEAADSTHPAHAYFADRYTRVEQEISDEISNLQHAGRFLQTLDPHDGAKLLISLSDGLQVRWLIDPTFDIAAALAPTRA